MDQGDFDEKQGFLAQISNDSAISNVSTLPSLAELSSPRFFEHRCAEIDAMASRVVDESAILDAISSAVMQCPFCVSIADPADPDVALIAVSEMFEAMTGYSRSEVLGRNCRLLNHDCPIDTPTLMGLRSACRTGASFTAVLTNRRKNGELFFNLLDLRGLTVARNVKTGEELWFLVGIQADVTSMHLPGVRDEELQQVRRIASDIRTKLIDELSALAVASAFQANLKVASLHQSFFGGEPAPPDAWCLLPVPTWRHGCHPDDDVGHYCSSGLSPAGMSLVAGGRVGAESCHPERLGAFPVPGPPASKVFFAAASGQSPEPNIFAAAAANSACFAEKLSTGNMDADSRLAKYVASASAMVFILGCYWTAASCPGPTRILYEKIKDRMVAHAAL